MNATGDLKTPSYYKYIGFVFIAVQPVCESRGLKHGAEAQRCLMGPEISGVCPGGTYILLKLGLAI